MTPLEEAVPGLPTLKQWLDSSDPREGVPAKIQFSSFGARMAMSDPMFRGMSGQEWLGNVPREEFPYVSRLLLRYGPEAEVLYPGELRDMVKTLFQESLKNYMA
ncbi:hypothetical protein CM49_02271 [Paenibacillus sp. P1XP2]|nr:hypothetical protein CM49_02271 [Paenibacillus sp. P1XP2]